MTADWTWLDQLVGQGIRDPLGLLPGHAPIRGSYGIPQSLPAPSPDTVAGVVASLGEMMRTRMRGAKVLQCHPDVAAALYAEIPDAAPPTDFWMSGELGDLLGIPIVGEDSMEPGAWRITHHTACEADVDSGSVTHENCPVLASGVLRPEESA